MKTTKLNEDNFQTCRRFMIVKMTQAGMDNLEKARVLRDLWRETTPATLAACATAIKNREGAYYRDSDLVHDIMGVIYEEAGNGFVPRIREIAEVY